MTNNLALVVEWHPGADEETKRVKMMEWARQLADAGFPNGVVKVTPVWEIDSISDWFGDASLRE